MTTYVFDADGVVCIGGSFSAGLAREHGITAAQMQPFFHGVFRECIVDRSDLKEVLPPWLVQWGWTGSVDAFLAFWFMQEHVTCPTILAHVRALRRRGHRCVLATNQERHRATYLRQEMGLGAVFDAVFASCDLGCAKPSPEFFHQLHTQLGGAPQDYLLIDDAAANVTGAREAGWRAHLYAGVADLPALLAAGAPAFGA